MLQLDENGGKDCPPTPPPGTWVPKGKDSRSLIPCLVASRPLPPWCPLQGPSGPILIPTWIPGPVLLAFDVSLQSQGHLLLQLLDLVPPSHPGPVLWETGSREQGGAGS